MIAADDLAARMAGIEPIGREGERGTTRLAWSPEDEAATEWFREQAEALGRPVERDPAGNLWACPDAPGPWWAVGSHLDSVRNGGSYDGALGVAAAFAVAARSAVPVAVISFADEEGARFNTPTFGSRALVGALDVEDALARVDDRGTTLAAALDAAGVEPAGLGNAPLWLKRLRGFLELHIDQARDVAEAGAPAGVVSSLAARIRLQALISGSADHAGTTPLAERSDALAAAARLIVAAEDAAAAHDRMVFTPARIEVEPNAATTVPSRARLWLDARAPQADPVESWREEVSSGAERIGAERRVGIEMKVASWSAGTEFPDPICEALLAALPEGAPDPICFAGHDAGIVARRRPAGMILVRNERGVSHSPRELVSLEDAAVAAGAMLSAVERLGAEGS